MNDILRTWWFWLIIIAMLAIIIFVPLWCTTIYLPGPDGLTQQKVCRSLLRVFEVY